MGHKLEGGLSSIGVAASAASAFYMAQGQPLYAVVFLLIGFGAYYFRSKARDLGDALDG